MMATQLELNIRIRTEESDEYSICGSEFNRMEHSIDSISIVDESISLHIMHLQKLQEEVKEKTRKSSINRSHSLIYVRDEQTQERTKSNKVIFNPKSKISIEHVPHNSMAQLLSYHRCSNLARNDLHNRAYGAMFGFLIGDSLGASLVNRPFSEEEVLNALMMKGGGVMNLKPGEGTDEWQICLSLCEGLIECRGSYNKNTIAGKYLEWIDSNPFDLPVLMAIPFSQIRKKRRIREKVDFETLGQELRESSLKNIRHESMLGLIRIIPLTIWGLNLEEYEFNHLIKQEMRLITPNEFVVQTSLVFANLLKCIMKTGDHLLAYEQASENVYRFGSEKMIEVWDCIIEHREPTMSNSNANHLKFPLIFAINELLEVENQSQDLKKSFIQSAIRVLSKGFNTDSNCSIVLGLMGAIVGYNNIPSYFRSKILNSQSSRSRIRSRDYSSKRIIEVVAALLRDSPTSLE